MKSWTALAPGIIHAYWLKKLTVPANSRDSCGLTNIGQNNSDHEGSPQGYDIILLLANYLPLRNTETCLSKHNNLPTSLIRHMCKQMTAVQIATEHNGRWWKH